MEERDFEDLFGVFGVGADASPEGTDRSRRTQRKATDGVLRVRGVDGPKRSVSLRLSEERRLAVLEVPMMLLPPLSLRHHMARSQHQIFLLSPDLHPPMLHLPQFPPLRDAHVNRLPK